VPSPNKIIASLRMYCDVLPGNASVICGFLIYYSDLLAIHRTEICWRTQRSVLLHVTSRRSRDPSLLLRDPSFTTSPRNMRCGAKREERKTSLTAVAQSRFDGSVLQQLPHGVNTPQYKYA
jgi:hypothetical protein